MSLVLDNASTQGNGGGGLLQFGFSTYSPNDILYAICGSENDSGYPTISDSAGLTWNPRGIQFVNNNGGGTANIIVFWALAPSLLNNDTITLTPRGSNSSSNCFLAAVSGANLPSPFDPYCPSFSTNVLPANGNGTVSTVSPNTLILGYYGSGASNTAIQSPLTNLNGFGGSPSQSFNAFGYLIAPSPQLNRAVPAQTGDTISFIADAFVPSPSGLFTLRGSKQLVGI